MNDLQQRVAVQRIGSAPPFDLSPCVPGERLPVTLTAFERMFERLRCARCVVVSAMFSHIVGILVRLASGFVLQLFFRYVHGELEQDFRTVRSPASLCRTLAALADVGSCG